MSGLKCFCDEIGIDLETLKDGQGDEVVVKRDLASLKNGFVFGLWNELMVEERKVCIRRDVIEKMRVIICKYFAYEKSGKALESRVLRMLAERKRCQKDSKDQVVQWMGKCFCQIKQPRAENVNDNVDQPGPSEISRNANVKNSREISKALERKHEEHCEILKDAMREVQQEKSALMQKSEADEKRVKELKKEVEKLKARQKARGLEFKILRRKVKYTRELVKRLRARNRKRGLECSKSKRRVREADVIMEREILKVKQKAAKEWFLREKALRKELECKCIFRTHDAVFRFKSERKKKMNVQKLMSKKNVLVKQLREKLAALRKQLKNVNQECCSLSNNLMEVEEKFDDRVEEHMKEFLNCGVCTFKDGTYQGCVREVYQDLMTMNVGAKNVERVIRIVLSKLTTLDEKEVRLPKETFAKSMLLEARSLAQMQCVSEVTGNDDPVTLCTDATTKWGYHYGTYDMSLSSGKMLTLGLRPMVCGSAEKTLDGFKEIVGDIVKCARGGNENVCEIVRRVKNTMSDRHAVEKKFNEMLKEYRADILPKVVKGWDNMTLDEQAGMKVMNNFFCGMHFVVGLANQASMCLKVWEKDVLGEKKVGSTGSGGCGAERLVRTVCKSVQERACDKFGKPVYFRVFLESECRMDVVPLAPFRGNRFNILFHNGAGVYHLYPHLLEFFDRVKDENELMRAVYEDLKVDEYRTEVRALGLIDKIVTTPLWKVLNIKEHVSGMNERYKRMIECFEAWSEDASEVLHGEARMFPDVKVEEDAVYNSLVKPCENDGACKEVLQCLFGTFVKLGRRMLESQIGGGTYENMDEQMKYNTRSVPRTNVDVERDFGMFDRLLREKPRATEYAIESVIMCRRNQMSEWRDKLPEEEKSKMMRIAQDSVKDQRKEMCERRRKRFEEREKALREKKEGAEKRERRDREAIRKIALDMNSDGPLWLSVEDMDENLSGKSEKEQDHLLKVQMRYRKKVMKDEHSKDGLLNMSSGGKPLSVKQMRENMSIVLGGDAVNDGDHVMPKAGVSGTDGKENGDIVIAKRAKKSLKVNMFIGRLLTHSTLCDSLEKEYVCVLVRKRKGNYLLRYDDGSKDDRELSKKQLQEDLDNGSLREMEVGAEEVLGRDIEYMWLDDDSDEMWCRGRVIGVEDSGKCVVAYEPMEGGEREDEDWTSEVLVENLIDDYREGKVRFV